MLSNTIQERTREFQDTFTKYSTSFKTVDDIVCKNICDMSGRHKMFKTM